MCKVSSPAGIWPAAVLLALQWPGRHDNFGGGGASKIGGGSGGDNGRGGGGENGREIGGVGENSDSVGGVGGNNRGGDKTGGDKIGGEMAAVSGRNNGRCGERLPRAAVKVAVEARAVVRSAATARMVTAAVETTAAAGGTVAAAETKTAAEATAAARSASPPCRLCRRAAVLRRRCLLPVASGPSPFPSLTGYRGGPPTCHACHGMRCRLCRCTRSGGFSLPPSGFRPSRRHRYEHSERTFSKVTPIRDRFGPRFF